MKGTLSPPVGLRFLRAHIYSGMHWISFACVCVCFWPKRPNILKSNQVTREIKGVKNEAGEALAEEERHWSAPGEREVM